MSDVGFWTEERTDILKSMFGFHTSRQIATKLGCTRNTVCGKIHRMKLSRTPDMPPPETANGTSWVKSELDELRRLAGLRTNARTIAAAIGRTEKAVKSKAKQLGLRLPQPFAPHVYRKPSAIKNVALPKPSPIPVKCKPVPLVERTGCCFIVTEKGSALYCNNTVKKYRADGMWQYCADHLAVMNFKLPKPEKKPDKFVYKSPLRFNQYAKDAMVIA